MSDKPVYTVDTMNQNRIEATENLGDEDLIIPVDNIVSISVEDDNGMHRVTLDLGSDEFVLMMKSSELRDVKNYL